MTHVNEEEIDIVNKCTSLVDAFAIIEKVMIKENLDPELIQDFKNDWWAGAFDTIHVVLNLIKENDPAGLKRLHAEVHHYMDNLLTEVGESRVQH